MEVEPRRREQQPHTLRRFLTSCCLLILTAATASAAGWTTSGTKIISPTGAPFTVAGVNWYGFETRDNVAHGMWTKDYKTIIDQIKQHGYNTVRIPFSNAMWEANPVPNSNQLSACPECKGKRARDIMAMIVNYAGFVGLHVILDNHRSTAGNSAQENGLWYASGYPEPAWIRDWVSVQEWAHGVPQTLVEVRLIRAERGVLLSVKDEGQGIPAGEMDRLFRPFERTSVRSTGGSRAPA